jgi:hypothetical protein
MEKIKCDCGKDAVWCYMPGYASGENSYSCDDCVGRGCTCNMYSRNEPEGGEGVDWQWVVEEGYEPETYWQNIDEKGRVYPCCEYDYEEEGFDEEDFKE